MTGYDGVPTQKVDQSSVISDRFHIAHLSRDDRVCNRISIACADNLVAMIDDDIDSPEKRLRFAREKAGYAEPKDFAERLGINVVTYRSYENGTNGYTRHAAKFAKALKVTADWLLQGGPVSDQFDAASSRPALALPEVAMVRQVDISYAMGDGSVVSDYPETGFMPFDWNFLHMLGARTAEHLFISRGEGDSMAPTIFDNDLVMVDASRNRISMQDRIWALSVAGAGMIKRLRALPDDKILVLSDNPSVPEQVYDAADVYIVGKVIWIGRRM